MMLNKLKRLAILCTTLIAACIVISSVVFGITGCDSPPAITTSGNAITEPETTGKGDTQSTTGDNTTDNVYNTTGPEAVTTEAPQTLPPATTRAPETTRPAATTARPAMTTARPAVTTKAPETTRVPAVTTNVPETTRVPDVTTAPAESTGTDNPPAERPVVTQYPVAYSERVGDEWFSDAVFIGDSRTQGLQLWGDIKTATYYAYQGLNVYTATTNAFINENGQYLTIAQAIARHPEFKKIYVCLGVNEYWMAESSYKSYYTTLIDSIMAANPSAAIYIYAVSPLVDGITHSENGLNNTKMAKFNQIAKELAISRGIYYIDADAPFTKQDSTGQYRPFLDWSESSDGVHLNSYGLSKLTEYLRTHTK